jgi:alkylhydroperoxidase family enzyme
VGRRQGISEQQLLDLAHFETSPAFSELERLVLRYAVAMTETPLEVPDELFAELRRHFSPQQLVELTSAIAWENYRTRFDHAFGIEAEGFSAGAVCPLPVGRHPGAD